MRLINIKTQQLESFLGDPPPYAILSHTWGPGEITLQDLGRADLAQLPGWIKILGFLDTVKKRLPDLIEYAWVDTCCIDKTSSAELSEAINAMFLWYKHSEVCYAYLEDMKHDAKNPLGEDFEICRWFDRGWTLQELLAPRHVEFFDNDWCYLGNKLDLAARLSKRTNIDEKTLLTGDFTTASVARRMSWAAGRQTTRSEDLAYCMLGIFDINMPMIYGEGEKAFVRLQEEILKEYDDQSIFAWDSSSVTHSVSTIGVLAAHPSQFKESCDIEPHPSSGEAVTLTNKGVQIDMAIIEQQGKEGEKIGLLSCICEGDLASVIGIPLAQSSIDRTKYSRTRAPPVRLAIRSPHFKRQRLYLTKRNSPSGKEGWATTCWLRYGPDAAIKPVKMYPFSYWHHSPSMRSITMTMPYTACATSDTVLAAATFKVVSTGDYFSLLLYLKPQDRKIKSRLVTTGSTPDAMDLEKLLKAQDGQVHQNEMEIAEGIVRVKNSVQLIRGSWMYDIEVAVTSDVR